MVSVTLMLGDCLERMRSMPDKSVDTCITDPPYELGFMGKNWDNTGVAFQPETWAAVYRVLKPGAILLALAARALTTGLLALLRTQALKSVTLSLGYTGADSQKVTISERGLTSSIKLATLLGMAQVIVVMGR